MKRKGLVILVIVAVVGIFLVDIGVKAFLEGSFPIKNYGLTDEDYALALEKVDTFAEELESIDLDGFKIFAWDDFHYYHYKGNYEILVDYRAPAEKIKNYIIENVAEIKEREDRKVQDAQAEKDAAKKSRRILKELKKKGLNIECTWDSYKQRLLMGLESLEKALGDQEIKDLKAMGVKIYIASYFSAFSSSKEIWIDYQATPEEIRARIRLKISAFKMYEKGQKELLEEARKLERERKEARKKTGEKIKSLKKSIREKIR